MAESSTTSKATSFQTPEPQPSTSANKPNFSTWPSILDYLHDWMHTAQMLHYNDISKTMDYVNRVSRLRRHLSTSTSAKEDKEWLRSGLSSPSPQAYEEFEDKGGAILEVGVVINRMLDEMDTELSAAYKSGGVEVHVEKTLRNKIERLRWLVART